MTVNPRIDPRIVSGRPRPRFMLPFWVELALYLAAVAAWTTLALLGVVK